MLRLQSFHSCFQAKNQAGTLPRPLHDFPYAFAPIFRLNASIFFFVAKYEATQITT